MTVPKTWTAKKAVILPLAWPSYQKMRQQYGGSNMAAER
jgi:hypothetical protein